MTTYNLPGVKPWVQAAADEIGTKFNVRTVGGVGSRPTNPTSDHPFGLALDFMVSTAQGDQVAAYATANSTRLGIKYVIWKQRVWYPNNPVWKLMEDRGNATANHYDHVHVSFNRTAPSGGPVVDPNSQEWQDFQKVVEDFRSNPISDIQGGLDAIGAFFTLLSDGRTWLRVGMILGGALLLWVTFETMRG